MDSFFQFISSIKHVSSWGYIIIFFISFFESFAFVGLLIPGTILLIFAGFLSAHGIIDPGDLFIWAVIGAILGYGVSFFLGKREAIEFRPENKLFKPSLLSKGETYFKKYGARSVFLGRFIGWVRPIIPFIAGLFKLDPKVFLVWNVLSALLWAASHIALGYFFGQGWQLIMVWSTRVSVFVTIVIVSLIVFYLLKRFIVKKGKKFFAFFVSVLNSVRQAVAGNPEVQRYSQKHAQLFRWLNRRFDRNDLFGLPTTFLVLTFVYALSFLSGITEDVITSDPIVAADTRIANLLEIFRGGHVTMVFLWVTLLGKWQIVLVFILAAVILLWICRKRLYIVPLFITVLGSETMVYIGKLLIRRPRPEVAMYAEHSFSFPSGHAAIAAAFYGFIAYILIRNIDDWKKKVNIFFTGLLVVLLIGFSRLYLGVHYVSDVWGGYLIGALWLIIGISISEWLFTQKQGNIKKHISSKNVQVISIAVIFAALLIYGGFARIYNPIPEQAVAAREVSLLYNIDDIFSDEQLKYTETVAGSRQEPLNFIIIAEDDERLIEIFREAGWYLADPVTTSSIFRFVGAIFSKKQYPQAPMTPSFWNTRVHNFGFEKSTDTANIRERHHARFWKTRFITEKGKRVYVGTASLDKGMKWLITHTIAPDIDSEREFLFQDIQSAGNSVNVEKEKFVPPAIGKNFSGDSFFTDGLLYLIEVR